MSAKEKLLEIYKNNSLLKGINLTEENIMDAVFYVDELTNCKKCKGRRRSHG